MARGSPLAKLSGPAQLGIGLAVVLVVVGAYFLVFYGDLSSSIQAEQSREQGLKKDLAEARQAEFAYQKDLAELTERQQRQRELSKILPSSTEYPAFLSSVQTVANITGVSLSAWTPQEEIPEEFYARVPMLLELRGRFHQVARFFYSVGQQDRIINMENIHITDPHVDGDEIQLKVDVLATAFRSKPEAEADGSESADKRKRGMDRERRGGQK